jgi:hypothetical protein
VDLQPHTDPRSTPDQPKRGFPMAVWIVPGVLLAIATQAGAPGLATLWVVVMTFMGAACLVNAKRCHRLHCYITGPFFLLLALVALLFGFGVIDLGPRGWLHLTYVMAIGACVLTYVPEWLFGKYWRSS